MTSDIFLIGAPRCGTSTLFEALVEHPAILGSMRKEPFFLMDPGHPLAGRPNVHDDGPGAYSTLFPEPDGSVLMRLDGTTHYLFQRAAIEFVAARQDARVVVLLRDPADRVLSSFRYTRDNRARLAEGIDFGTYLELTRRGVPLYPDHCRHRGSAYVLERDPGYSRYSRHLSEWFRALGRDRIRVLILEEMAVNPAATISGLIDWLGLDPHALRSVREPVAKNRSVRARSSGIHGLVRRAAEHLPLRGRPRRILREVYGAIQYRRRDEPDVSERSALEQLRAEYREEVRLLENLLGRDLSCWPSGESTEELRPCVATESDGADGA